MKVKKTYDYEMFSFFERNRRISEKKLKELVKSIQEIDLTEYLPIIVTDYLEIIDGQHRFEACKKLGLPVYYFIFKGDRYYRAMELLNSKASIWKQDEFIKFNSNKQNYKELLDFDREIKMGISNAIAIFCEPRKNASQIKSGTAIFKKSPFADKVVSFLKNESVKELKFKKQRQFVVAVRKFIEENNDRKVNKLLSKILLVPECISQDGYLRVFGNITK
jgi:hypothetical protein